MSVQRARIPITNGSKVLLGLSEKHFLLALGRMDGCDPTTGSKTVSRLSVSPGTLEMHSTWALQTLNWSTSEPGWLASMMTTLLAEWVLVRIHTRLLMVSVSWSSLDWTEGRKGRRQVVAHFNSDSSFGNGTCEL